MKKSGSRHKKKNHKKHDHNKNENCCEDPTQNLLEEKDYEKHKNLMEDPEEFQHFKNVVAAFFNYKHDSMKGVQRMKENFEFIGKGYQKFLKTDYTERLKKLEECIDNDYIFLCHIVHDQQFLFPLKKNKEGILEIPNLQVAPKDVQKMRATIRQFVRDWSIQGKEERDQCYKPITEEFKKYFPEPTVNGKRIRALFPGCGLSRLVFEFALMGYGAQGNEFSYFMLLASNFILNVVDAPEKYEIHPFIHNWCNLFQDSDAFESYKIPDICPVQLMKPGADFSMVAGEFVEVYKDQKGEWDSVITCFFIDTANNIIQYIETIFEILKEGGVWINFGPLLYHYADMETEKSIELSWEEVRHIIVEMGFEIKNESVQSSGYAQEKRTMMEMKYNCIFFTAVKPISK